jgi:hypothetical protein
VTAEEITDVNTALTILKALADGANPFTGQVFPHNSVYQHPQVVCCRSANRPERGAPNRS